MDLETKPIHCALCRELLKTVEFNLKSTNSRLSKTPLLSIIESIAGKVNNKHYNICLQCLNLINELDAIHVRQTEIRNHFIKYVKKSQVATEKTASPTTNIVDSAIINEKSDISPFDDTGPGKNSDFEIQESDLKSDSEFFNSDLIDDEFAECSRTENKPSTNTQDGKPISKKKARKKKYSKVLKVHKCHCSKEFRTRGELKTHMKTHNPRQFVCEICGQAYRRQSAFNIHMDMHNGINPFTCIYCKKSFTQKGALARHMPIHTGEMPYQCDECGKRFIHHTSFNVHRLSHTGVKSYKCTLCGLALMSASHLTRHMRIHTGEKKYACDTCGKRFAERYNLAVHERLHSNPGATSLRRRYSCQICDACFERKTKLDEHFVKEHQTVKVEVSE